MEEQEDTLDLERLRLSQDFASTVGVRKKIITVPVRKPDKQAFVRVHPEEPWRLKTAVIELKEERETYLVDPDLYPELSTEVVPQVLFTAMNRQGVVFLWPVRLPGEDGRSNPWNESALEAAELAMKRWVRVAANMSLGAYEVFEATAELSDPVWPDESFEHLVNVAFKDRFIRTLDHPVVRRLRGEV